MKKLDRFLLICGSVMAVSELGKQYILTFVLGNGSYNWWYFPFQLCSLPMYLCLIYPFLKSASKKQAVQTFLMDYTLLSGLFAFCDTSGMHYPVPILTVHSFLWHILLIAIGLTCGILADFPIRRLAYQKGTLIYLGSCMTATFLNLTCFPFGPLNMFYISPRYVMTQIVFVNITELFGNRTGILSYLCATMAGAGLFHAIWHFLHLHFWHLKKTEV